MTALTGLLISHLIPLGIGQFFSWILTPLYDLVSLILLGWHKFIFGPIFGAESGWSWGLSIVGLTVLIRTAMIPLFVRQIKSSRNMQLLQPKIKELQKKYGHDRQKLGEEQMKLFKETGTNPLSSFLPILLQSPVFFALYRVLYGAAHDQLHGNVLSKAQIGLIAKATIFGAPISSTFRTPNGGSVTSVHIVTVVMVILMSATMFITQRQLMRKNMPAEAATGQAAQVQKLMLYGIPVFFLVFGLGLLGPGFPLGILIYLLTTNLFSMGQQLYVIERNPTPGSPAYKARAEKVHAQGKLMPDEKNNPKVSGTTVTGEEDTGERRTAVQHPRRQTRSERKRTSAPGAAAVSSTASGSSSSGSTPAKKATTAKKGTTAKKSATAKKAAGSNGSGPAKSNGTKSGGAKSDASRPNGSKSNGTKSNGSKSAGEKSNGSKSATTKSNGSKSNRSTSVGAKSNGSRSAANGTASGSKSSSTNRPKRPVRSGGSDSPTSS